MKLKKGLFLFFNYISIILQKMAKVKTFAIVFYVYFCCIAWYFKVLKYEIFFRIFFTFFTFYVNVILNTLKLLHFSLFVFFYFLVEFISISTWCKLYYLLVDPNPPILSPCALSSSVIKYFWKIACPIASPFFITVSSSFTL